MDPTGIAPLAAYRQHLEVETPEHVVLDFEVAGLGSRLLASLFDMLVMALWILAVLVVMGIGNLLHNSWVEAVLSLVTVLGFWGYFALFEGLRQGQTPGKRRLGIRVVQSTGHPVTFGAAVVRNLLRALDLFPPTLLLDAVLVATHRQAKRLGDLAAGTMVVRDRPFDTSGVTDTALAAEEAVDHGAPELSEDEFRLVREFAERSAELLPDVRQALAARLLPRFAGRFTPRTADPTLALAELFTLERARRRSRFAPAARGGGVAERFTARKMDRWEEFQRLADRATRDGLDRFAAAELPEFAARYREVAADLARARTYHAPPLTISRLERLVAAGHNALYRDQRTTAGRIWHVLMRECPAAVVQARGLVLVACLTFGAPLVAGVVVIREDPSLAEQVLPESMLRRAEAGAARQAEGRGYYEASAGERPAMAGYIIGNNIRVAFLCFAGGILAGIGALVMLAFNGLSIGATYGHFANAGLAGYLGTFIAGHGTLELFAICVAGAAGYLLGIALIAPGRLSRGEALVVNGRQALRMIGAVAVMLLVAGVIEGFVSAGTGSVAYRLAVGAASLVFLVLYLANGAAALRSGVE